MTESTLGTVGIIILLAIGFAAGALIRPKGNPVPTSTCRDEVIAFTLGAHCPRSEMIMHKPSDGLVICSCPAK